MLSNNKQFEFTIRKFGVLLFFFTSKLLLIRDYIRFTFAVRGSNK